MSDDVLINFEDGCKRVLNNTKLYIKMLGLFKKDNNIEILDAVMAEKDYVKAQSTAHTLKGLAGNLSLSRLFDRLMEMDSRLKTIISQPDAQKEADAELKEKMVILKNVYNDTIIEIDKVISKYAEPN